MKELVDTLLYNYFTNPIIIIILVLGFISAAFYKQIVGWFGEHWTRQALNKLPKDKYLIINDVFIKVNNHTHQIDHVIVSPYGIFSIETKQYNGYITGSKYDKKWIRHAGKYDYYYTNPIRQNYGHVKALSELLNIAESRIFNIVCIPSKATLKIEHDGELVGYYDIADKILSYKEIVIDNPDEIIDLINKNNITDRNIKKEHISNIRNKKVDEDYNMCPKCGGQLVERNGKYGLFYGCSNYPKCKYTRK